MLLKTAFDIDGVVCHTWKLMIEIFNEKGYNITEDDMTCFNLEDCLNIPSSVIREVIEESLSRENMPRKEVEKEAIECLKLLHNLTGKAIPFITSRKNPENTIYYLKNYIIKGQFPYNVRHGSWVDGKTCGERKLEQIQEFGCVAMVEDAPETLKLLTEHSIIPILIDRPYNRYATWCLRFKEWQGVFNLAMALEKLYVDIN